MKTHYLLDVEITLLGPVLTKGGQAHEPGIDAPLARDAESNFMLPYSLVKGMVLDAFRDLRPDAFQESREGDSTNYRTVDPVLADWLGNASSRGDDPDRGRLRFSDFVTLQKGRNTLQANRDAIIERICISDETGSVMRGALAMFEAPFGYGEEVTFKGRVEFLADKNEAQKIEQELTAAFKEVPAFGALRTVGFGRHVPDKCKLTLRESPAKLTGTLATGEVLPFQITLDRPLCVVGPKHSGNHFDSLDYIPGAVLKGAIARLIQECTGHTNRVIDGTVPHFPTLCAHFENIRFAEAVPLHAKAQHRPIVPPRSLVVIEKRMRDEIENGMRDVALLKREVFIQLMAEHLPLFQIDWKSDKQQVVESHFGKTSIRRESRTRTAIERGKGRSKDQQLFSYGLVVQKDIVWDGAIGLEGIPDSRSG